MRLGQTLLPVASDADVIAVGLQVRPQQAHRARVVLDDEHVLRRLVAVGRGSRDARDRGGRHLRERYRFGRSQSGPRFRNRALGEDHREG